MSKMVPKQYDLTYEQMNIWLHQLRYPNDVSFNIPLVYKIGHDLNIDKLAKAFEDVYDIYTNLGYGFGEENGIPYQFERDRPKNILDVIEISNDDLLIKNEIHDATNKPFNLKTDYLFRFKLIKLETSFFLILNIHHIVIDGYTFTKLLESLSNLYLDESGKNDKILNYKDGILKWHETGKSYSPDYIQKSFDYWNKYLLNCHKMVNLVNCYANDEEDNQSITPNECQDEFVFDFTSSLSTALKEYSAGTNKSLFETLMAGFIGLLFRYGEQDDICVNYIKNLRNESLKNAPGYYCSLQPCRVQITKESSLSDIIDQVKNSIKASKEHLPYSYLKHITNSEQLYFDISFNKSTFFHNLLNLGDSQVDLVRFTPAPAFGSLTMLYDECRDTNCGFMLKFKIGYDRRKYPKDWILYFADHFKQMMEAAISSDKPIYSLDLLQETELKKQFEFNMNDVPFDSTQTFYQLFEKQVEKTPNKLALVFEDEQLTYHELNTRANKLAHYLRKVGICKADTIVGLCSNRSIDVYICILGIMKAGGVLLPFDPTTPKDRIKMILDDSKLNYVILESQFKDLFDYFEGNKIFIDSELKNLQLYPETNLPSICNGDNLVYMIFTSGSTGTPKGAMIAHNSLCNLVLNQFDQFLIEENDKILQQSSFNFDMSVFEWGAALGRGATLCTCKNDTKLLANYFVQVCNRYGITYCCVTPSVLTTFEPQEIPSVKKIVIGGETIPKAVLSKYKKHFTIINGYGPTETTVVSTACVYEGDDKNLSNVIIGSALANAKLYILNDDLKAVPIGFVGELHIGGPGVCKGYLNRVELTQNKFIPNPLVNNKACEILYKTGDLVRYLPDGKIEYLGRRDNQIKIRGFRIELDEIEKRISDFNFIETVAVVVHRDSQNSPHIVAYMVFKRIDREVIEDNFEQQIRFSLKKVLPDYMIPQYFVKLEKMPVNISGKSDKKDLEKRPIHTKKSQQTNKTLKYSKEEKMFYEIWKEILNHGDFDLNSNFFRVGGDSISITKVYSKIPIEYKTTLQLANLFEYATIKDLVNFLSKTNKIESEGKSKDDNSTREIKSTAIAIIGMSCRFPEANNPSEFWQNLISKRECLKRFSKEELSSHGINMDLLNNPNYIRSRGLIENFENFDAKLFGWLHKDAQVVDPQQRVLLECAFEALESSGYLNNSEKNNHTGVFVSCGSNTYFSEHLVNNQNLIDFEKFEIISSNEKDFLATRISYKLDLKGPAITVQTACSSSLVSVHLACKSLLNFESNMCLAGGVSLGELNPSGYLYKNGMIYSSTGQCCAFDEKACGTVVSQGAGIVLLKRLDDAINDNDHIFAVIKGSAINNDGFKGTFHAPSESQQANLINEALKTAKMTADDIDFIETHGTGTELGDLIELTALNKVFNKRKHEPCLLGALKNNIGHTDAASGVAGLIKTTLSLYHRQLPATINFNKFKNVLAPFTTPFSINSELFEFKKDGPIRAGVSSFGIGGTNCHVILEDSLHIRRAQEENKVNQHSRKWNLFCLSAHSPNALELSKSNLIKYLVKNPNTNINDLAVNLSKRKTYEYRSYWVADTCENLLNELKSDVEDSSKIKAEQPIVFLFSGQNSKHLNMAKQIYEQEIYFQTTMNECINHLNKLFPAIFQKRTFVELVSDSDVLKSTSMSHPILFAVQYSLAKLLIHYGIQPTLMLGHSFGEYAVACLSKVIKLDDALAIVTQRGILIETLTIDSNMLAVELNENELSSYLKEFSEVDISVVNATNSCVLSGKNEDVIKLKSIFKNSKIKCTILKDSVGYHSHFMGPILNEFKKHLDKIEFSHAEIPFISSITSELITDDQASNQKYWVNHLRQKVNFSNALETITQNESYDDAIFVDLGPGDVISSLIGTHLLKTKSSNVLINCMRNAGEVDTTAMNFLSAVGELWKLGVNIDWNHFNEFEKFNCIPIQIYGFDRKKCFIEKELNNKDITKNINDIQNIDLEKYKKFSNISRSNSKDDSFAKDNLFENIQNDIKRTLSDLFEIEVQLEDNFTSLGVKSLDAIQFINVLNRKFGINLKPEKFMRYSSISKLSNYICKIFKRRRSSFASHTLVELKNGDMNKQPLYLIHPVGGDLLFYGDLIKLFDVDQPVYGFRDESLNRSIKPFKNIPNMASHYIKELLIHLPRSSYILAGSSFGGIVAYEMAQQLKAANKEVPLLILIDSPCPSNEAYMPKLIKSTDTALHYLFGKKLNVSLNELEGKSSKEQIELLSQKSKLLKMKDKFYLNEDVLDTWIANSESMWLYKPRPYDGNILFFSHTDPMDYFTIDPAKGWQNLTNGTFSIIQAPGNHLTMVESPNAQIIAKTIQDNLNSIN